MIVMSSSYRPMRRADRQLGCAETRALLKNGEYGVLSTAMERGAYGVPVNYAYDEAENCIYIHCAHEGQKLDNIARDNSVCFTVVGRTRVVPDKLTCEYESVIAFGSAQLLGGNDYKNAALALGEKYSRLDSEQLLDTIDKAQGQMCVLRIDIAHMTGKALKNAEE